MALLAVILDSTPLGLVTQLTGKSLTTDLSSNKFGHLYT